LHEHILQYCLLHICAVEQTMLCDSRDSYNINNVIHATYTTHAIFREGSSFRPASTRCEVPCWQQQLECERDAEPQICEADAQEYWASWLLTMFLHCLAWFFSWVIKNQISSTNIFYFGVCGNLVEENIKYQELQKICREKVCRIKVFWANLEKFRQNIICTPKKFPFLHLWLSEAP